MKLLIVEDEIAAARRLQKMLQTFEPASEVLAVCDSIVSSEQWFTKNQQPDLIFMDIQLADGLSFDIFSRVQISAPVIFTTAYDEYALRAFKVNSIDYLLKPVDNDELVLALNKYRNFHANDSSMGSLHSIAHAVLQREKAYRSRFLVAKGHRWIPVSIDDVAWFISEEKHVSLVTRDNHKHLLDVTLEQLEEQLDPEKFTRANRQFIVSDSCVKSMENGFNGKLHLAISPQPEEQVTVSREKAGEFRKWLGK
jgi:DNA-binding LytR/AlgR family response regulator